MFDSLGVEEDESALAHIEGDAGFGVLQDSFPEGVVLVGYVFNDEAGVVCGLDSDRFVFFCGVDNLYGGVPQVYAIELAAPGVVKVEVTIGIVGLWLEEHIAYEFVVMGRMYAETMSVPPALRSCAQVVYFTSDEHHPVQRYGFKLKIEN